jgi:hypothetical protein
MRKLPNPTGKGGFKDNPQNISKGNWSKETSISYWYNYLIRLTLEEFEAFEIQYVAQELAYNSIKESRQELPYLKEVTDRTDGKAQQSIDHTTKGDKITSHTDYSKLTTAELLTLRELETKATIAEDEQA